MCKKKEFENLKGGGEMGIYRLGEWSSLCRISLLILLITRESIQCLLGLGLNEAWGCTCVV